MYFKTGDNGGSVKLSSKFVRSTVLSGCHWQHSCCTLNAELSCNWEEKSNISRKRYLSGMEQPEPKHSQKKSNHSRPKKYWVAQNTKFWGIMWDFISSKFCLKIQARRPGRGIMDSGSTVMLGLLCQFGSIFFWGVTQAKDWILWFWYVFFFFSLFFGEFWHKCDRVVDWCSNPTHACCQGGAGGWKKINLRLWAAFLFCYTEHWERPILQQIDDRMALLKHISLINLDFRLIFLEFQPRLDLCP